MLPGYHADIAVLDNLTDLNVLEVYKDGELAAENGKSLVESSVPEMVQSVTDRVYHSFHVDPVQPEQLAHGRAWRAYPCDRPERP